MICRGWTTAVIAAAALITACSPSAATPTQDPLSSIEVTASARDVSLVATGAFADFGLDGGGAHQVRVRIVDGMDVGLRIAAGQATTLAEPPSVCLVGPYSAPDDAGLESPCWGEPDVTALLLAKLDRDAAGHYLLSPDRPIDLDVQLTRGTERCDYPAGTWEVELKVNPLVAGTATGARYVPDTPFDVPLTQTGPLQLLPTTETRYCGLATAVFQQQGEPEVTEP